VASSGRYNCCGAGLDAWPAPCPWHSVVETKEDVVEQKGHEVAEQEKSAEVPPVKEIGRVGETVLNAITTRRADGTEKVRPQVVRPDAVAVLPVRVTAGGVRMGLFVQQARPVVGEPGLWEVPAGKVDPGEHPADTAARELQEETGYIVSTLSPLAGRMCVSPGYTIERMHFYAATVAEETVARRPEDQDIDTKWWPLDRVPTRDMKTTLAVLLAQSDASLWPDADGPVNTMTLEEAEQQRSRRYAALSDVMTLWGQHRLGEDPPLDDLLGLAAWLADGDTTPMADAIRARAEAHGQPRASTDNDAAAARWWASGPSGG
jgi:ADP-ribose pyrophosphatase